MTNLRGEPDLSAFENAVEGFMKPAEIQEAGLLFLLSSEGIKEVKKLDRRNLEHEALIKKELSLTPDQEIPYPSSTVFYQGLTVSGPTRLIMYTPSLDRAELVEPLTLR